MTPLVAEEEVLYRRPSNYVNGILVPSVVAASLVSMGAAASCPTCKSGDTVGADNNVYRSKWIPAYNLYFGDPNNGSYTMEHVMGHYELVQLGSVSRQASGEVYPPLAQQVFQGRPELWRQSSMT